MSTFLSEPSTPDFDILPNGPCLGNVSSIHKFKKKLRRKKQNGTEMFNNFNNSLYSHVRKVSKVRVTSMIRSFIDRFCV